MSLFLPEGDGPLAVHGRIINPNDVAVPVYWWTNIAVATPEGGRVLSRADYSIEHVLPDNHLERFSFPREGGLDLSYPAHWQGATSVFFRNEQPVRNLVALVDAEGNGTAHVANEQLPGRKFFYFGAGSGGQHWMEYLSREGEGDYVEIQAGITPHQNQRYDLEAGTSLEWTSVILPLSLSAEQAHNVNYARASEAAEAASRSVLSDDALEALSVFLSDAAKQPAERLLCVGSPWGARHERIIGHVMAEHLSFDANAFDAFWDAIADNEVPPECADLPEGFVVSPSWVDRLERLGDAHWLGVLYRSIAALDKGDREEANRLASLSVNVKDNWLARRQLALTARTVDEQREQYLKAWSAGDAPVELAVEIADFFQSNALQDDALAFIDRLSEDARQHERILIARARLAAAAGRVEELEALLSHDFSTIREGETITEDLWLALVELKVTQSLGHKPSADALKEALKENPLPLHLDFRMREENHTDGDA